MAGKRISNVEVFVPPQVDGELEYCTGEINPVAESLQEALTALNAAHREVGWRYLGFLRERGGGRIKVRVFYARLAAPGATPVSCPGYEFHHVTTRVLPRKDLYEAHADWTPLVTKRWNHFDRALGDACITFFVRPQATPADPA